MATSFLLVDANALIDYVKSDVAVLTLASRCLGQVHVLSTVLDEVEGLDASECERLGLVVVEPESEQLAEAAARRGRLSVEDRLCLIVARARAWTCVTNDGALRRACVAEGVPILWGIEVMTRLVDLAVLTADAAIEVANAIHDSNPLHIPRTLVDRFAEKVREIETHRAGE